MTSKGVQPSDASVHRRPWRLVWLAPLVATPIFLVAGIELVRLGKRSGVATTVASEPPSEEEEVPSFRRRSSETSLPTVESPPTDRTEAAAIEARSGRPPDTRATSSAAAEPAPPPTKRSDFSPAAMAAERSRIARTDLDARASPILESGPLVDSTATWRAGADALREELTRSLVANTEVQISDLRCFAAGCLLSFDSADDAADVQARGRVSMLLRGEMPNAFPGTSFVSGLMNQPDGSLRRTIILYAPGATQAR